MSRKVQWQQAYAVVRVDRFRGEATTPQENDGPGIDLDGYSVTVKEVVLTAEAAKAEAERLNALNATKNCRYYWQGTRYFPDGGSFGVDGVGE